MDFVGISANCRQTYTHKGHSDDWPSLQLEAEGVNCLFSGLNHGVIQCSAVTSDSGSPRRGIFPSTGGSEFWPTPSSRNQVRSPPPMLSAFSPSYRCCRRFLVPAVFCFTLWYRPEMLWHKTRWNQLSNKQSRPYSCVGTPQEQSTLFVLAGVNTTQVGTGLTCQQRKLFQDR